MCREFGEFLDDAVQNTFFKYSVACIFPSWKTIEQDKLTGFVCVNVICDICV